jgi:hypothetical protein
MAALPILCMERIKTIVPTLRMIRKKNTEKIRKVLLIDPLKMKKSCRITEHLLRCQSVDLIQSRAKFAHQNPMGNGCDNFFCFCVQVFPFKKGGNSVYGLNILFFQRRFKS